ncbi:hypothetical protein D3C71_1331260 [compost metagenome]
MNFIHQGSHGFDGSFANQTTYFGMCKQPAQDALHGQRGKLFLLVCWCDKKMGTIICGQYIEIIADYIAGSPIDLHIEGRDAVDLADIRMTSFVGKQTTVKLLQPG